MNHLHRPSRPASTFFRWTVLATLVLASSLTACDRRDTTTGGTGATGANPPASAASR